MFLSLSGGGIGFLARLGVPCGSPRHRAVREMKADGELNRVTKVRSSKYLNHLIEQDHRGVKSHLGPMLGFKRSELPESP
jgi:transposase-like protein